MIVTEKNVSTALAYLSDDPHPLARARFELTNAENKNRETFARLYLAAGGSVEARKAAAEIAPDYVATKETEAKAQFEFERHRSRVKAAEAIIDTWRTENANARAAEKIR